MMWKRIILWIVTLLWACGIFCLSAQPAKQSGEISGKIKAEIVQGLSEHDVSRQDDAVFAGKVHYIVRKAAHVALYLVLGILLFLLFKSYNVPVIRCCLMTLGTSVLYGISDELHQLLVSGRSGQITDVLLDGFGAFIGILLVLSGRQIWKVIIKKR